MLETGLRFFDHSQHTLKVENLPTALDVLTFTGEEGLSQPFRYTIEFTCTDLDLSAERMLAQRAMFSLHAPIRPVISLGLPLPPILPLRTVHGHITGFERLSHSADEARYQITLQPRLALLDHGCQYRLYQHQSVPQIVEQILRQRHEWHAHYFWFDLIREYPIREQVMQYGESDLAFISRLLAEVGIWYRFVSDDRLATDVLEFHDWQCHYQFGVKLPLRPQGGLSSSDQDAVWALQTRHRMVDQKVHVRTYQHRDVWARMEGEIDHSRGAIATYGERYLYAERYTALGTPYLQPDELPIESGYFYARLAHERQLNDRTRMSGITSSAALAPGQVLTVTDGAPQAFEPGALITSIKVTAARDSSLVVAFEAMAYSESVGFRPPLLPRPRISGTLPARVTSNRAHDRYGHIDLEGRYKVNFLFDRDSWKQGQESAWLRLARPYAGDTHGLHLPLLCGTEVAVAFEQGDPDRPYIAHALHDNKRPDLVTLRNYKRNVLRTPANNKLRMDDSQGQEHIKLSTEYGGKSQLNLGHMVDGERKQRGEGFELRTDGWGVLRAGKGLFITADGQPKARGQALAMNDALAQFNEALATVTALAQSAAMSEVPAADGASQKALLKALTTLKEAGLIISAPAGVAVSTPSNLQISAGADLIGTAGANADLSVRDNLRIAAGKAVSLFASSLGLKLVAAEGPVTMQAQTNAMALTAQQALTLESTNGEIRLNAAKGITLVSGGAYITLKDGSIEIGAPGELRLRNDRIQWGGAASLHQALQAMTVQDPIFKNPSRGKFQVKDEWSKEPLADVPYSMATGDGAALSGVTDEPGYTQRQHTLETQPFKLIKE